MEDGEVKITRNERLRIPRQLDSAHIAKLRVFRTRISDWTEPSRTVYDEPIIVSISSRGIERTVDHFHSDVTRFEDLLSQKKLAGYTVSAKDAVLAYLLVRGYGSRHSIAGFLTSKYATPLFPELDGTPSFPEFSAVTPETVGQALSRLKTEGWTT